MSKLQLVRAFGDHHKLCHLVHNYHCELAKLVYHCEVAKLVMRKFGIFAAGHGDAIGITPVQTMCIGVKEPVNGHHKEPAGCIRRLSNN